MPFKGPRLALCVASSTTKTQVHGQVCRIRREGPRTLSRKAYPNLDCAFVENKQVSVAQKIGKGKDHLSSVGLSELPDSLDGRSRNSQETHDQTKRAAVVKTVVAVTTIPATVSLHMESMVINAYYSGVLLK